MWSDAVPSGGVTDSVVGGFVSGVESGIPGTELIDGQGSQCRVNNGQAAFHGMFAQFGGLRDEAQQANWKGGRPLGTRVPFNRSRTTSRLLQRDPNPFPVEHIETLGLFENVGCQLGIAAQGDDQ